MVGQRAFRNGHRSGATRHAGKVASQLPCKAETCANPARANMPTWERKTGGLAHAGGGTADNLFCEIHARLASPSTSAREDAAPASRSPFVFARTHTNTMDATAAPIPKELQMP